LDLALSRHYQSDECNISPTWRISGFHSSGPASNAESTGLLAKREVLARGPERADSTMTASLIGGSASA
jgi:hypothetical protein